MNRLLLPVALGAVALPAGAQTIESNLYLEDEMIGGKFYEVHTLDLSAGDAVRIVLRSDDFDTFVYVKAPSEAWTNNDDCTEGDTTTSCLDFVAEEDGIHEVWASTFQRGEYGDYTLTMTPKED